MSMQSAPEPPYQQSIFWWSVLRAVSLVIIFMAMFYAKTAYNSRVSGKLLDANDIGDRWGRFYLRVLFLCNILPTTQPTVFIAYIVLHLSALYSTSS